MTDTSRGVGIASVSGELTGRVVVVDPGHNENNFRHVSQISQIVDAVSLRKACDTAGTSTNDGYSEAAFTTDVANRVAARLRALGATVVLTRGPMTPWGPCITERAAIGNRAHADVGVSIHADGGPAGGRGFHVIEPTAVGGPSDAIIGPSRRLGSDMRSRYAEATAIPPSTYAGHDGIDVRGDLGGLNLSFVPKVFIECGNMRNSVEAHLLEDPSFRERAAEGIVGGIVAFLHGL